VTMKAVRMIQPGQPLEMQEIPIPAIGPRDVLVKVKAAGICHSDVHYRAGTSRVDPLPLTLGHEVAGVVEEIGAQVTGLKSATGSACTTWSPAGTVFTATRATSNSARRER
jgi:D-arabinose 1-dehydrogenase-like Zn-dependent alcohol dehydrogenase